MLEQGCAALLQGHEVAGFVVGHAIQPAAVKDADPLERKGALQRLAPGALCMLKRWPTLQKSPRGVQLESENPRESVEVLVGGQDRELSSHAHRADQEVRV